MSDCVSSSFCRIFSFVLDCLIVVNALVVPGGDMYVLNVGEGTGAGVGQHLNFTSARTALGFRFRIKVLAP